MKRRYQNQFRILQAPRGQITRVYQQAVRQPQYQTVAIGYPVLFADRALIGLRVLQNFLPDGGVYLLACYLPFVVFNHPFQWMKNSVTSYRSSAGKSSCQALFNEWVAG